MGRRANTMAAQTDYAWAAGFIDADGCVSVSDRYKVKGKRYPNVQVIVVQRDLPGIIRLQEIFGADEKIGETRRGSLTYFRLTFSGKRASEVLTAVLPYLILKKEVGKVALDLCQSIASFSRSERAKVLPETVMEYRRKLVAAAKVLNSGAERLSEEAPRETEDGAIVRSASN